MFRLVSSVAIALAVSAPAFSQTVTKLADAATVKKLEALVKMPAGAGRIETYVRYYGFAEVQMYAPDGKLETRSVLAGVYLASTKPQNARIPAQGLAGVIGARAVAVGKALPEIDDGGCSVVTVYYDLEKKALIELPAYDPTKGEYLATAICNGNG